MSAQLELNKIIRFSKRSAIAWAAISLVSLLGLVRVYSSQAEFNSEERLLFPLAAGMILAAGFLCLGSWFYFRSLIRNPGTEPRKLLSSLSRPQALPVFLFFLVQLIAGGLIASTWLNLRLLPAIQSSKYFLVIWIAFAYLAPFALFLLVQGENYFARLRGLEELSIRNGALLLVSIFSSALVGLAAAGLFVSVADNQTSPFASLNTYLIGVGLPFLVLDINLALSTFLPAGEKPRKETYLPSHSSKYPFLSHPLTLALLFSVPFSVIFLTVLRPGYGINDDFGIISLASGYLGGTPVPFLAYSNVLLGFILNPIYSLHTNLNWLMIFFLVLNFLSTTALLYIIFSLPASAAQKIFGALAILICDGYFVINITYTIMAAFATISGLCLILSAVQSGQGLKKGTLILGIALALTGSLIRFESWLLVLVILLPALIFSFRAFQTRNLVIALVAMGLLVVGCYVFNRLFIRTSPDWSAYYTYNQTRSKLHDTPRLANMGATVPEVGWNENDLVMFTHWFFPDPQVYSLEHLQYLVGHVSNRRDIPSTLVYSFHRLIFPGSLPYILIIASTWLGLLLFAPVRKAALPLLVIGADSLAVIFFLAWTRKLPDRVLLPLLAAAVIFGLFILFQTGLNRDRVSSPSYPKNTFSRLGVNSIIFSLVMAIGLVAGQSIQTSLENVTKQTAYLQILADIKSLVAQGKIPEDALIVSNATGIPLEWSYPLTLELPVVQYLDMGWFTNSPSFNEELKLYGVQSLPAGFYQNSNVYLMTRENMMFGILQFIRDHEGVDVNVNTVYRMPNKSGDSVYDNVALYKLDPKK